MLLCYSFPYIRFSLFPPVDSLHDDRSLTADKIRDHC